MGQKKHHLLFDEQDERFEISVAGMRNGAFIYLESSSQITSQCSYLDANKPKGQFKAITPRKDGVRHIVEDDGKDFYILTNENAKNFRLVKVSCKAPKFENWQELIAHREDVFLTEVDVFVNHLVVYERQGGLPRLRIQDSRTGGVRYVSFPESVYEVVPANNFVFDTDKLLLNYGSLATPMSALTCDMTTGLTTVRKQAEVLGYDQSQYKCERIFAPAEDGTLIPMSLVYKGELVKDGSRKFHVLGYGAYGLGLPADFRLTRLNLLDSRHCLCHRPHPWWQRTR